MRRRALISTLALALCAPGGLCALGALGCDAGVRGRTGLQEMLRVSNATFVAGPLSTLPDPTVTDGPAVMLNQFHGLAFPGASNRALAGSVGAGGRSVAIGLADDGAYWIVPAANANREVGGSTDLLFSATLSYAPDITLGRHDLVLRAILADGRWGPPVIQPVMISAYADVTGAFQITLRWDTNADLDLHVIVPVTPPDPAAGPPDPKAPTTIEVWVNQPSSLPPRPVFDPYTPDDLALGGLLTFDSNGSCIIDGRREESVVWGGPPPSGSYIVRVDAVSLCGEVDAQWQVDVFNNGDPVSIATAVGEAIDSDTRFSHRPGSGVLALEFKIP